LRRTKFFRPATPQDFIVRPRLNQLLAQGVSYPLTLISAPAGFGKTMLVSSFLQNCGLPWVWLSLDDYDNDLQVFLDCFGAALAGLSPGALLGTRSLLAGNDLPPLAAVADSLLNELDELGCEFCLILDDLQVIHNMAVYDFLATLLLHPLPQMHLVLLSREDPPLSLPVLRARGQMSEIRLRNLRFTPAEAAEFLEHTLAFTLPGEILAALAEQTEGWAAALRLAALNLRYRGDVDPELARLQGENQYVMDYLVNEVLIRIPPAIQDFLIKTSILDLLCISLCDAVVAAEDRQHGGQAVLQWLAATDMFTVALDDLGQWYRYHHLFRALLRRQLADKLSAQEIETLHRRASVWYAAHDSLELALEHALAGHDVERAVQLVAQHRHTILNTERWSRLDRWLRLFPAATIDQYPDLLLAKAWVSGLGRTAPQTVLHMLDRAQAQIAQGAIAPARARQLEGEIDALRCMERGFAANDPQVTMALAVHALECMPPEWYIARAQAYLHLAGAYQLSGQIDRAFALLAAAQQEEAAHSPTPRLRLMAAPCFIHWMAADLSGMLQAAQRTVNASQGMDDQRESLAWGHFFLASVHYQRNDLVAAELTANLVQEQRYMCHHNAVLQSAIMLAGIHQARGAAGAASAVLERAKDHLREIKSAPLLPIVDAFGAELAARQGDTQTAADWAMTEGAKIPFGIMAYHYAPQFSLPKVLLRMNTPASRRQAADALERLYTFVTTTHNTRFKIDVLAMQALYYDAEGHERDALDALHQAVALAQPGGIIRVFVDLVQLG
jgi:LuxR family maltose regulon positive regulatory protein